MFLTYSSLKGTRSPLVRQEYIL